MLVFRKFRLRPITLPIFVVVTAGAIVAQIGHAQASRQRLELFTSYVSARELAFQVHIPAATCTAIITQADRMVSSAEGFKGPNQHDLQVASLNLRSCATSPEKDLARIDRDLAVGLYGEVVSELERREIAQH